MPSEIDSIGKELRDASPNKFIVFRIESKCIVKDKEQAI